MFWTLDQFKRFSTLPSPITMSRDTDVDIVYCVLKTAEIVGSVNSMVEILQFSETVFVLVSFS